MAKAYEYRVLDTVTGEWFPGIYQSKGIRELLDADIHPSDYATYGMLVKRRYKIVFAGDIESEDPKWADMWDEARMKILKGRRR